MHSNGPQKQVNNRLHISWSHGHITYIEVCLGETIYGPAGPGKSAIAQTITEMCDEEMIMLACFFFSRNDPSCNTIKPLIATIAYQITSNLPDVKDAILEAITRDSAIFSKSLAVQVKSLIVAPLQPLAEAGYFIATNPPLAVSLS